MDKPLTFLSGLALVMALALVLASGKPARAELEGAELRRVEALLGLLATKQDIAFVRNGSRYQVDKAVSHLRTKLRRAKGRISTCEQFVDHVASGSTISGKPYQVILPDGTTMDMRAYLRQLLPESDAGLD
jgi:hypothetical protein